MSEKVRELIERMEDDPMNVNLEVELRKLAVEACCAGQRYATAMDTMLRDSLTGKGGDPRQGDAVQQRFQEWKQLNDQALQVRDYVDSLGLLEDEAD